MNQNIDILRKKLAFRSKFRAMRELDYYISAFSDRYLNSLTLNELYQYEALLDAEDPLILDWILGLKPIPNEYNNEVWQKFKTITAKDFNTDGY